MSLLEMQHCNRHLAFRDSAPNHFRSYVVLIMRDNSVLHLRDVVQYQTSHIGYQARLAENGKVVHGAGNLDLTLSRIAMIDSGRSVGASFLIHQRSASVTTQLPHTHE